ncbi:hypothetical protein Q3G72_020973 [Acer saccharum]|nr:hypothetical protein Q3G72_031840 [Acer saccharum]KAK1565200.1 hypothetical protein Q3G72_020973 [Acer saccharum]
MVVDRWFLDFGGLGGLPARSWDGGGGFWVVLVVESDVLGYELDKLVLVRLLILVLLVVWSGVGALAVLGCSVWVFCF